jgi:hypothetical protein
MSLTDFPLVKLKTVVNFPANAFGRRGINVAPQDGNFFIDVDYSKFVPVSSIPGGAPNQYMLMWDNVLNKYVLAPVSLLGLTGGIADAPSDGTGYARINAAWQRALMLAGGTLSGPLILAAPPTVALGAATKQYVDDAVAIGFAPTQQIVTAAGDVTVQNSDSLIVLNKLIGQPTNILMPSSATKIGRVKIVDWKGDAGTNNFTIVPTGGDLISGRASWTVGGDNASIVLDPVRGTVNGYAV